MIWRLSCPPCMLLLLLQEPPASLLTPLTGQALPVAANDGGAPNATATTAAVDGSSGGSARGSPVIRGQKTPGSPSRGGMPHPSASPGFPQLLHRWEGGGPVAQGKQEKSDVATLCKLCCLERGSRIWWLRVSPSV